MATSSAFLVHLTVLQPPLFAFFTLPDAVRLLATCRNLREDTETASAIVSHFPVAHFVMQCSSVSALGCTPRSSPHPLHSESWASALSIAGRLASQIVPSCYQWQTRRGVSTRIEPFLLPLSAPCADTTAEAIEKALQRYGVAASTGDLEASWKLHHPRYLAEDSDDPTDSDSDSDWDDDDDTDSESNDEEAQSTGSVFEALPVKCLRTVQTLVDDSGLLSLCRLRVDCEPTVDPRRPQETRELLVGLNCRGTVVAGVLVRTKAAW